MAVTLEPLLLEDRWRGLWNVISEDTSCTVTYEKLYTKLASQYGHLTQGISDDMFKYMVQCMTDSTNTKFNDANLATVCQVTRYFKERSANGVARFIRQLAQEYSIVHGLQAHLLRDREDAVQRLACVYTMTSSMLNTLFNTLFMNYQASFIAYPSYFMPDYLSKSLYYSPSDSRTYRSAPLNSELQCACWVVRGQSQWHLPVLPSPRSKTQRACDNL